MKDSGIGTPATRAAIIERLITVGYLERDGRALVADREGTERDPAARRARPHLARADRLLGAAAGQDRARRGLARAASCSDIAGFAGETVKELDETLKDVRIPRARLGPCPVCGHEIVENRKGYSCWAREDPGCGFVIWKAKAGKQLPLAVARELIRTGYTAKRRDRLPRPQRAQLPRPPRAQPDRGGQMARGVRRAVGEGGRQAPRRRGAAREGLARGGADGAGERGRRAHAPPSPAEQVPARAGRVPRVRQDCRQCRSR